MDIGKLSLFNSISGNSEDTVQGGMRKLLCSFSEDSTTAFAEFSKDVSYRKRGPIFEVFSETIELRIVGNGNTVNLGVTDLMQPAIGVKTDNNMSYGRWSITECNLGRIILDNIKVHITSANPTFSIGQYGTNLFPAIELYNNAELFAPDYQNDDRHRYMTMGPIYSPGSTKISNLCEYVYCKEDEIFDKSDFLRQKVSDLKSLGHSYEEIMDNRKLVTSQYCDAETAHMFIEVCKSAPFLVGKQKFVHNYPELADFYRVLVLINASKEDIDSLESLLLIFLRNNGAGYYKDFLKRYIYSGCSAELADDYSDEEFEARLNDYKCNIPAEILDDIK